VFRVRNATFIFVSRKRFATFLTSLPLYVNVAHFVLWFCELTCVFCFFRGVNILITFMLYSLFRNMFLMALFLYPLLHLLLDMCVNVLVSS
jgi:hypothetical protein